MKELRTIILAAGKGTRLEGITQDIPMPMLNIKGEIILEHNLKWLRNFDIKDIYINLHHKPEVIKDYFNDGRKWDLNI